jgi:hypothetical protein
MAAREKEAVAIIPMSMAANAAKRIVFMGQLLDLKNRLIDGVGQAGNDAATPSKRISHTMPRFQIPARI